MNVTVRVDEDLKREADELFEDLGMSFTTAVNVFLRQAVREGGIPFEIGRGRLRDGAKCDEGRYTVAELAE